MLMVKITEVLPFTRTAQVFLLSPLHAADSCVFQDVCKIVGSYCQLLKDRVRVLSENSDHSIAINMASTASTASAGAESWTLKPDLSPCSCVWW